MRDILFRGQTRKKGQKVWMDGTPVESNWVYGGIFPGTGDFSVIYTFDPIAKCSVYSDTVGQFTGLTDKNGKKIFEGDIIKIPDDYDEFGINAGEIYEVYFAFGGFRLKPKRSSAKGFWLEDDKTVEIIGNIHDNPELLEVSDNGNL